MSGENNPFSKVVGVWDDVLADMERTAAEYRDAGWEVVELHPGDVETVSGNPFGFDVVVPTDEFEEAARAVETSEFTEDELFRNDASGVAYVLAVMKDPDRKQAVCCPIYYELDDAQDLIEDAKRAGVMYTHVRPLQRDREVTFTHDEPERFF